MRRLGSRALSVCVALLAVAAGGCSWLIGVSEDPVLAELAVDAGADAEDAHDGTPTDLPDVEEAAVEDAPVE